MSWLYSGCVVAAEVFSERGRAVWRESLTAAHPGPGGSGLVCGGQDMGARRDPTKRTGPRSRAVGPETRGGGSGCGYDEAKQSTPNQGASTTGTASIHHPRADRPEHARTSFFG